MQAVDLREDGKVFRQYLEERVKQFVESAKKTANVAPISAVEVGFCYVQAGWILVHFDQRLQHERDGEWTNFNEADLCLRDEWSKLADANIDAPVSITLHNGKKLDLPVQSSDELFASAIGRMLVEVLKTAKKEGLFDPLPKQTKWQIDVEDFNGNWAWPEE